MVDPKILEEVAGERKTPKGKGKHYIPFNLAEWAEIDKAFGRKVMPNDLKLLILGMVRGKVGLTSIKPEAPKA